MTRKYPDPSAVAVCSALVALLTTVTVAPPTMAPEASTTVPPTAPSTAVWAWEFGVIKVPSRTSQAKTRNRELWGIWLSSKFGVVLLLEVISIRAGLGPASRALYPHPATGIRASIVA